MSEKGLVKIFDIVDGELQVSVECHTEPYLKAILDRYTNPVPALNYIYYKTYPWSAYNNFPEEEREEAILNTYPGEYTPEDVEIVEALKELDKRYHTPLKAFYQSQKHIFEVMTQYYSNFNVSMINDDGMKGNLKELRTSNKEAAKLAQSFLELENLYKEQLQSSRLSGGQEAGYDEFIN